MPFANRWKSGKMTKLELSPVFRRILSWESILFRRRFVHFRLHDVAPLIPFDFVFRRGNDAALQFIHGKNALLFAGGNTAPIHFPVQLVLFPNKRNCRQTGKQRRHASCVTVRAHQFPIQLLDRDRIEVWQIVWIKPCLDGLQLFRGDIELGWLDAKKINRLIISRLTAPSHYSHFTLIQMPISRIMESGTWE